MLRLWLFYFGLWLLLSGYFSDPLLLAFGALSSALVAFVARRVRTSDPGARAVSWRWWSPRAIAYWPWLLWQVVLANLDVAKCIVDPKLPIHPMMIGLRSSQRGEWTRVVYANSITLTPGTVTTDLSGDAIEVHALTRQAADFLLEGGMDRHVSELEGVD
ncbi:MAG: Na+/H+ antiporter subunit E [Candidatus Competibacter sp.]|nr:Na+/H+ antiporter subunit E [Candidatus Competibacter sp.]